MRYKIYNDVQNNPDTIKLLPPRNAKKLGAVVHRTALLKICLILQTSTLLRRWLYGCTLYFACFSLTIHIEVDFLAKYKIKPNRMHFNCLTHCPP